MKQSQHGNITFTDGFWQDKETINRQHTIPIILEQSQRTGRIDAMKLNWQEGQPNKPHYFWDSDVAKWLEAASYSLKKFPDHSLEQQIEVIIDLICSVQDKDGYFNSYFQQITPKQRWKNLRINHELYCAGHLIEAAVAYYETTGKTRFLDTMCRYADYIDSIFGPESEGKIPGYPGHEEIELALIKLFHTTNNEKYLQLSIFFIEARGQQPNYFDQEIIKNNLPPNYSKEQLQVHLPVHKQDEAVGHSVRACYLYAGMADIARETDDKSLFTSCKQLWHNITTRKMYITGGIGTCHSGESFTENYDLPNEEAYAETCAAISLIFFAYRMFQIDRDADYIDVLERALYNGVSSGVSLNGKAFFYVNPLASYPTGTLANGQTHKPRSEWFECACCPSNIARLQASLGHYFYDLDSSKIWINLYNSSTADFTVDGTAINLRQKTDYPWHGNITIDVSPSNPVDIEIALRIPNWCKNYSLQVNSKDYSDIKPEKGYVYLKRLWQHGDTITLTLDMPVELVKANPKVRHNCGRSALMRGPLVYCIEEADNGQELNTINIQETTDFKAIFEPDTLGGIMAIYGTVQKSAPAQWDNNRLYSTSTLSTVPHQLKAIPYFSWANRKFGEMLIWIRN